MSLDEPGWWYDPSGQVRWQARMLQPAAYVWGTVAKRRMRSTQGYRSRLPVVCVGNFTSGGTGKTPVCLHLAEVLKQRGHRPVFLTRGYGARVDRPVWVDPERDRAAAVGDEPLMLSRAAPVMVSRDRAAGARAIEASSVPASVIIMDDGLQNPGLIKDLTLAVVDAGRGFGNGCVIPAGPLRAPLRFQLGLADALVINHSGPMLDTNVRDHLALVYSGPILSVHTMPHGDTQWLRGARVTAYCGIGNPARFYQLLNRLGAIVADHHSYRDHHTFSATDARTLIMRAAATNSALVTTEKDWVRLLGFDDARKDLRVQSRVVSIKLDFEEGDRARVDDVLAKLAVGSSGLGEV